MATISKYAKIIAGVVAAVLLAFAFAKTYEHGYTVAQAIGDRNLSDYKASIQQASASAASDAFGKYATDVTRGQAAESGFLNVQSAADTQAVTLKEHIEDVSQPYIPAPQRAVSVQSDATVTPVYSCVFSRGFVRLWNAAAGIADDSDRALQGGTDSSAAADGSGSDATTDSGVSQADIIDWFVDYANRAHGTENKIKGVRAAVPTQQ
jgi:hypothetical protein